MALAHHYRVLTPAGRRRLRALEKRYPRTSRTTRRIKAQFPFVVYGTITLVAMTWTSVDLARLP